MLSALGASAQTAITLDYDMFGEGTYHGFDAIPGPMTINGQAIGYIHDTRNKPTHTVTLTDEDFKPIRSFSITPQMKEKSYWQEETTEPFSLEVKVNEEYIEITECKDYDVSDITNCEQLKERMGAAIGFYDFNDRISCSNSTYYSGDYFYYYDFGYKYPVEWYFVSDKKLYKATADKYSAYEKAIPSYVTFSILDGYAEKDQEDIIGIEDFTDYDNNNFGLKYLYFTQTLFNDDDKIEYIETEHHYEGIEYDTPQLWSQGSNHYTATRYANRVGKVFFNVKNEDGDVVMTFKPTHSNCIGCYLDRGFVLGGHAYIELVEKVKEGELNVRYSTLYRIDKQYGIPEMVKSVKADGRFASARDGMVNVSIDAADSGSDVILTNAVGQVVGRDHIGQGQTSAALRTGRLQHGVYNVSLRRDGRIIKNEKLMIK